MNNTIEDLRSVLFDTLRGLKDGNVDLDRAKAVAELSQTIINTGKLEVDYMRTTGNNGTGFIPAPEGNAKRLTENGIATRTEAGVVHRIR
jgi:hypothetical protein